ncbi:MAG TPA: phosphotransferase [Candidatus Limnocylindrales bacterium]|nr:phosphotransferase [Candidatus Limnocylindrales bacterium]
MATVEEVIAAIPGWAGRRIEVEELSGGLTNRNYLVRVDGSPVVVRVPGESTELLAIDRDNEVHNARAAAETGIAPRVLETVPAFGAMVIEYVPSRTMSNETLAAPGMPARVGRSLRQLHTAPRFLLDFDMFRLVERYMAVVDERAIPVPDGFRAGLPALPRLEAALGADPLPTVPCHNDLLAENYLDDGGDLLRIVDFEYSGNNDPCFELANTAQELLWDEAQRRELCAAYFGEATDALMARMSLQMIMSDMGWTLWAAIQARISTIEYDFTGWAEERWARADAKLRSPELEDWLRAVTIARRS